MRRVFPVVTIALLLVLGGWWLSRRTVAEGIGATPGATDPGAAQSSAQDVPVLPDGFAFTPFLSAEPVRVFEQAEQVLEPDQDYQAILETTAGTLRIDLYEDQAPMTVNNFVFLALHHYYDGVPFHRVIEGFMAQTGDPTGTGRGGPGYQFAQEIAPDLKHDKRGVVAMANAGPDTNGSQFFITFGPTPWLDGGYNIFGQVVEGDEMLDELTRIDPQTPSAIATLDDPLSALAAQGVTLSGDADATVEDFLTATLGALPAPGQTFTIEGYTAVLGSAGGQAAIGVFPKPDVLERVFIIQRPKGA